MASGECGMHPLGPLFTDLYELTMMAGYYACGKENQPSVFEYFFRRLPQNAGFAVFAGIGDLLDDLSSLTFSDSDLGYLSSLGIFCAGFIESLHGFHFTGDVWAPPEGSPVYPYEPLVRIHAPLSQAQLVETLVLCRLNYQTLIATKASRIKYAANGDPVMEFGLRRAQGPDGGMSGTRAAMIGGCDSTSNTLAGKCYGIPTVGTQAHSWIMAFPSELEAFRAYANVFPEHLILLVDTYDTLASGVPNAIQVFQELRERGWSGRPGIRIDSGDLAKLSKEAYRMLVEAGFDDPIIVGSSDLDEHLIAEIKRQGARVNSWGVGTKLMTGGVEPALNGVYKLAAVQSNGAWRATMKISDNPEKTTDPGVSMPVRFYGPDGGMLGDVIFTEEDSSWREGEVISHDRMVLGQTNDFQSSVSRRPLLELAMENGIRTAPRHSPVEIRDFARSEIERISGETRRLVNPQVYWVGLSEKLAAAKHEAIEAFWRTHKRHT